MPYQSIFSGANPALGGKTDPYAADFVPGRSAAINAQIAASQPKVVTKPAPYVNKGTAFSKLANKLGSIAAPSTAGAEAAQRSLDATNAKLLQVLKDPSIPVARKQGAYQAFLSTYDPSQASADTKAIHDAASVMGLAKNVASGLTSAQQVVAKGVGYATGANKVLNQQQQRGASVDLQNALLAAKLRQQGKLTNAQTQALVSSDLPSQTAANTKTVEEGTNKRSFAANAALTALQPFLLSDAGLVGANSAYRAGEGIQAVRSGQLVSRVPEALQASRSAQTAFQAASGGAAGVLGALGSPKTDAKSVIKAGLINAAIPLGFHGATSAIGALKGGAEAAPGLEDVLSAGQTHELATEQEQKLLTAGGQHQLPAVSDSTKAIQQTAGEKGGTFGAAAKASGAAAKVQSKTEAALNAIDERLAAIDRGDEFATPAERKDLFTTRQVLSGSSPAVRDETKATVSALTEQHANADVERGSHTLEQAVGRANSPLQKLQDSLPKGYVVDKTGSVFDTAGKELTTGQLQELTQEPFLTQFEHASQSGDTATMQKIADEHPGDARVHVGATADRPKTGFMSQIGENPSPDAPLPIKLSKGESNIKGAVKEIKNWFSLGKEAKPVQTDLRSTMGSLNAQKATEARGLEETTRLFNKMSPTEHGAFIQAMDTGARQATPELQAVADAFKPELEKDLKLAREIKPETGELENYFPHGGVWENSKDVSGFLKEWAKPGLGGKPSALESRGVPTIYDGIQAGLVPKETNPATLFLRNRSQLLQAKAAQDFLEQQTAKGINPDLSQKVVDRWLQQGLTGNAIYRTVNDAATALNSVQLGFSGFHFASTAMNSVFSKFGDGLRALETGHVGLAAKDAVSTPVAPIIDALKGRGLISQEAEGVSNKYTEAAHLANFPLGTKVDFQTTGLAKTLQDFKTGNIKGILGTPLTAPFRAIADVSKPLMEHWVPAIKAGAFKNAMDVEFAKLGEGASKDELAAAAQRVGDSIDNRFGQLTRDNIFWDARLKDTTKVLMRSDAWNIGTVREVGGGAKNLLMPSTYKALAKGEGLPTSTNYVLSLAAGTAMIGGTIQYLFTGVWPKQPIDYFYPRTGKIDKNGNPERVSLPTYSKDIFSFFHNPVQTVGNKLTPIIGPIKGIASNKDYFGNMVRNPTDSVKQQAKQVGNFLGKQVLPFSLTNANQRVDKGVGTKAQSFLGVNPAPSYITKSKFEQSVQSALNTALGSKALTPEQQSLNDSKSQAKQSAQTGDPSKIDALVKSGQLTKKQGEDLKTSSHNTSLSNQFSYLMSVDRPAAARLVKNASPSDVKELGDKNKLIQALQKTTHSKTAKPDTIKASYDLINALNAIK